MANVQLVESTGFVILVAGVILSNVVVGKMAKHLKVRWSVGYKSLAADRQTWAVFRAFRTKYGTGSLIGKLWFPYGLAGVGAVILIFGRFFVK